MVSILADDNMDVGKGLGEDEGGAISASLSLTPRC